jgi:hypothetical protein
VAAVDGSPATAWVAAEARATLTLDLANPASVGEVKVFRGSREPFPYFVETSSDGAHWTTVAHAPPTAAGSDAGTDDLTFAAVQARLLRLVFEGAGDAKPPNIAELIVLSKTD